MSSLPHDVAEGFLLGLWGVLAYFVAMNTFNLLLLASAAFEMRWQRTTARGWDVRRLIGSSVAPRLSMLAPAYDEGPTVAASVRALLTLSYPNLEVVLVNDGSSDHTLEVLRREFRLAPIHPVYRRTTEHRPVRALYRSRQTPDLVVVDKENGGKADALNAGLDVATGELVCAMDADTLIEPEALLRMVGPFLRRDDVVAAGGTIRVANGSVVRDGRVVRALVPRRPLAGIQVVEYLRAFLFGRLGWNRLGGNLIISGAFGLFRRDAVLAAGGYLLGTVGEDMELVARLRRRGRERGEASRVEFVPDPVAWTEVPDSLTSLARQRDRWQRGLADVLVRYRRLLLNPRFGALGLVVTPYFLMVELLAPVVELVGLVGLVVALAVGAVDGSFALLFFLVGYGYGVLLSCLAVLLDEVCFGRYLRIRDRLVLLCWAALENVGYRQLTSYWRLRGMWKYLRGSTEWGATVRSGFASSTANEGR